MHLKIVHGKWNIRIQFSIHICVYVVDVQFHLNPHLSKRNQQIVRHVRFCVIDNFPISFKIDTSTTPFHSTKTPYRRYNRNYVNGLVAFHFSEICMNHMDTFLLNIIVPFNMKLMWYSRPHSFLTKVSLGQRMNGHRIHIVIGHYGNIFRIHKFSFFHHNVDSSSSNHPKFRIRLTKSACFATIPISQNSGLVWDCNTANTLKPCPLLFQYNVRLKIQHGFQLSLSRYECIWFWLELHVLSSSSIQHFLFHTDI